MSCRQQVRLVKLSQLNSSWHRRTTAHWSSKTRNCTWIELLLHIFCRVKMDICFLECTECNCWSQSEISNYLFKSSLTSVFLLCSSAHWTAWKTKFKYFPTKSSYSCCMAWTSEQLCLRKLNFKRLAPKLPGKSQMYYCFMKPVSKKNKKSNYLKSFITTVSI